MNDEEGVERKGPKRVTRRLATQSSGATQVIDKLRTQELKGYCWIKLQATSGLGKKWRYRWFELKRNKLFICKDEASTHDIEQYPYILIDEHTIIGKSSELPKTRKTQLIPFSIIISQQQTYLAQTKKKFIEWVHVLSYVISQLKTISLTDQLHFLGVYQPNPPKVVDLPVVDFAVVELVVTRIKATRLALSVYHGKQVLTTWPLSDNEGVHFGGTFVWPGDCIKVTLCKYETRRIVGLCAIEIKQLQLNEIIDEWFPLRNRRSAKVVGLFHLRLHKTSSKRSGVLASIVGNGLPSSLVPLRVDSGDIVLWQNQNLTSLGTALVTNSAWNHVGMVVRWPDNKYQILQATGEGVTLSDMDEILRFAHSHATIAIRKLSMDEREHRQKLLYKFIHSVEHRPFTHMLKLLKANFGTNKLPVNSNGEETEDPLSSKSYFCSHLVGSAFLAMNLINQDVVCSNFLPKHWASFNQFNNVSTYLSEKYVFESKCCDTNHTISASIVCNDICVLSMEEFTLMMEKRQLTNQGREQKLDSYRRWDKEQRQRANVKPPSTSSKKKVAPLFSSESQNWVQRKAIGGMMSRKSITDGDEVKGLPDGRFSMSLANINTQQPSKSDQISGKPFSAPIVKPKERHSHHQHSSMRVMTSSGDGLLSDDGGLRGSGERRKARSDRYKTDKPLPLRTRGGTVLRESASGRSRNKEGLLESEMHGGNVRQLYYQSMKPQRAQTHLVKSDKDAAIAKPTPHALVISQHENQNLHQLNSSDGQATGMLSESRRAGEGAKPKRAPMRRRTTISDIRQSKSTHSDESKSESQPQLNVRTSFRSEDEDQNRNETDGEKNSNNNSLTQQQQQEGHVRSDEQQDEGKSRSDGQTSTAATVYSNTPRRQPSGVSDSQRKIHSPRSDHETGGKSRSDAASPRSPRERDHSNASNTNATATPTHEKERDKENSHRGDSARVSVDVRIAIPIRPDSANEIQSDSSRREKGDHPVSPLLRSSNETNTTKQKKRKEKYKSSDDEPDKEKEKEKKESGERVELPKTLERDSRERGHGTRLVESDGTHNYGSKFDRQVLSACSTPNNSGEVPLERSEAVAKEYNNYLSNNISPQQSSTEIVIISQNDAQPHSQHARDNMARESSGGRRHSGRSSSSKTSPRSLPLPLTSFGAAITNSAPPLSSPTEKDKERHDKEREREREKTHAEVVHERKLSMPRAASNKTRDMRTRRRSRIHSENDFIGAHEVNSAPTLSPPHSPPLSPTTRDHAAHSAAMQQQVTFASHTTTVPISPRTEQETSQQQHQPRHSSGKDREFVSGMRLTASSPRETLHSATSDLTSLKEREKDAANQDTTPNNINSNNSAAATTTSSSGATPTTPTKKRTPLPTITLSENVIAMHSSAGAERELKERDKVRPSSSSVTPPYMSPRSPRTLSPRQVSPTRGVVEGTANESGDRRDRVVGTTVEILDDLTAYLDVLEGPSPRNYNLNLRDLIENIQLEGYDRYYLNNIESDESESEERTEEGVEPDDDDFYLDEFVDSVFLRSQNSKLSNSLSMMTGDGGGNVVNSTNNNQSQINIRSAYNNIRNPLPQPHMSTSQRPSHPQANQHSPPQQRRLSLADLSSSDESEEDDENEQNSTSHVLRAWSTNFEPTLTRFLTHSVQLRQSQSQSYSGGSLSSQGQANTNASSSTVVGRHISGSSPHSNSHIVSHANTNTNSNHNAPLFASQAGSVDGIG